MTNLTERAMLINLSIKMPATTKKDKQATVEVALGHGTEMGSARVNKDLFPKHLTKQFKQVAREARNLLNAKTLPWNGGQRALLSRMYFDLTTEIKKHEEAFWEAAGEFCDGYSTAVDEARGSLGTLFREEDYPDVEEVKARFGFTVSVMPMTDSSDWRVSLGSEEEAAIKLRIEQQTEQSIREAAREPWGRMKVALEAMAKTLRDPEKRFSGTLVSNIQDLANILPGLNITEDPKLDQLAKDIKETLAHPPETLRTSPGKRKETAQAATLMSSLVDEYAGLI